MMISRALLEGASAALATTAELAIAGAVESRAPWAPFNAISPLIITPWSPRWRRGKFDKKATTLGLGVLISGCTAWAAATRLAASRVGPRLSMLIAAASGAGLAAFDYLLLPKRMRPRLDRWLSAPSIAAKYVVFAASMALPSLLRRSR